MISWLVMEEAGCEAAACTTAEHNRPLIEVISMRYWIILLSGLLLTSACAPAAPQFFRETFDDAHNGWTLVQNDQAEIVISGGQLRITVKQPDSLAWSVAAGKSFGDFTLDVDATPLAGPADNDYGVIVRCVNDDNFYRFEISSDGYFNIQKRQKGQWQKLVADWTESSAVRQGTATNHLRVVGAGRTLTFFVNQVQVAQVTDNAFARGDVGVLAGTLAEPGVQVAFDNFQVSK
jgi:hypothetical protein